MKAKHNKWSKSCRGAAILSLMAGCIPAYNIQAQVHTNNPNTNYEHCVEFIKEPPPKYGNQYPKGSKRFYNKCDYKIFIAWCFYDETPNFKPQEKGDCGYEGKFFQKSWTLRPQTQHLSKMDVHQKLYMAVCKGTGKNSVKFKDGFNVNNLYECKS